MKYDYKEMDFGYALKAVREEKDISQGQLANKLGIKTKDVSNYESRGIKTIDTILDFCNVLDCDIEVLLGFKDRPSEIEIETGLSESTVKLLQNEHERPRTSPVMVFNKKIEGKDWKKVSNDIKSVSSGVTSVDLFNGMTVSNSNGNRFRESMIQYTTELLVYERLKNSIINVVRHHNAETNRNDSAADIMNHVENVLISIRRITSLSSLTMAEVVQSGIDTDLVNFCNEMKKMGYSKEESRFFFDYHQSKVRLKSLQQLCSDFMIQFLDELTEGRELTCYDANMGFFDVTATHLYGHDNPEDSITRTKNHPKDSLKVRKLKEELKRSKEIQAELISTNNDLSAQLSDARWKIKALEEELEKNKTDTQ